MIHDLQATLAFVLNISSAVCLICLNKLVMGPFRFTFATTLSAFHFICSAITVESYYQCKPKSDKSTTQDEEKAIQDAKQSETEPKASWIDIAMFVGVSCLSLISLNLSLLVNTVGFYQIAKLLIVPFNCMIEAIFLGRRFSLLLIGAIAMVVFGVGIVTVTDFTIRPLGLIIAMISVVGSGMQQILCREIQNRVKMGPTELLRKSAWQQGAIMLCIGPFLDRLVSQKWVFDYDFQTVAVGLILMTCAAAVSVNISLYMTLRGFTAVAYSVMGHIKTILVLFGGFYFFGEIITTKKGIGMALAVFGMVVFSYESISSKKRQEENRNQQSLNKAFDLEEVPLKDNIDGGKSAQSSMRN
eukprot:TRINITY_DN2257_c0_g1_i4.p2 TRINITY_DN2257_c0_g1~~TRINITY_DN2257_c0_g1_i4.p2  ORF type:complete len:357 (-),score=25.71 TRINITY_DN2257_c0_g1_i4:557-1627(-)